MKGIKSQSSYEVTQPDEYNSGIEAAIYLMKTPKRMRDPQENYLVSVFLQKHKFFNSFIVKYGQRKFEEVCCNIQARTYLKGELVNRKGNPYICYVVLKGLVAVQDDGATILTLGPGESFVGLALRFRNSQPKFVCLETSDLAFFKSNIYNQDVQLEKDKQETNIGFICSHELFKGIPDAVLRRMSEQFNLRTLACNEIIYSGGENADNFYIIKNGICLAYRMYASNARKIPTEVVQHRERDFFGHEEIIQETDRVCTIKCVSEVGQVLVMNKRNFVNTLLKIDKIFERLSNLIWLQTKGTQTAQVSEQQTQTQTDLKKNSQVIQNISKAAGPEQHEEVVEVADPLVNHQQSQLRMEKHCIKLQQQIKMQATSRHVTVLMKGVKKAQHLIKQFHFKQDGQYFQLRYFYLTQLAQLKIKMKQLTSQSEILILAHKELSIHISKTGFLFNRSHQVGDECSCYLSSSYFQELCQLPIQKEPQYYRRKLNRYIQVIHPKIVVVPSGDDYDLQCTDLGIQVSIVKYHNTNGVTQDPIERTARLIKAIVRLQSIHRGTCARFSASALKHQRSKQKGTLVATRIINLHTIAPEYHGNNIASVKMFSRISDEQEELTVEVSQFTDKDKKHQKIQLHGHMKFDRSELQHQDSGSFYQEFLDIMRFKNGRLHIPRNSPEVTAKPELQVDQQHKLDEEELSEPQSEEVEIEQNVFERIRHVPKQEHRKLTQEELHLLRHKFHRHYFEQNKNIQLNCQITPGGQLYKPFREHPYIRTEEYSILIKRIQYFYRQFRKGRNQKTRDAKRVIEHNDHSISQYVDNFNSLSGYGIFVEHREVSTIIEEDPVQIHYEEQQKKEFMDLIAKSFDLSGGQEDTHQEYFKLKLLQHNDQLIVAWRNVASSDYQFILINENLVVNQKHRSLLERYRALLVYECLKPHHRQLYFVPLNEDTLSDRIDEILVLEKQRIDKLILEAEENKSYFDPIIKNLDCMDPITDQLRIKDFIVLFDGVVNTSIIYRWIVIPVYNELLIEFSEDRQLHMLTVYRVKLSSFKCYHISQLVIQRNYQKLIQFFSNPIEQFNKKLKVQIVYNENKQQTYANGTLQRGYQMFITTNIRELKPYYCLVEFQCIRLQGWFKSQNLAKYIFLYLRSSVSSHPLKSFIEQHNNSYFRISYCYMVRTREIKVLVQELQTPEINIFGVKTQQSSKPKTKQYSFKVQKTYFLFNKYHAINLPGQSLGATCLTYMSHHQFQELQTLQSGKTTKFYRSKFEQFINIIHSKAVLTQTNELEYMNLGIQLQQIKHQYRVGIYGDPLQQVNVVMAAITKLQTKFRTNRQREWYLLTRNRVKEIQQIRRNKGKLVRQQYIRLNTIAPENPSNEIVSAHIYAKPKDLHEQVFIEVSSLRDRSKKGERIRLQGLINIDKRKILTSGTRSFYEVLLDSVCLQNGMLRLSEKKMDKFTKLPEFIQEQNIAQEFQNEQFAPKYTILDNVNSFNERESKLVYNLDRNEEGTPMLYNVIYSGSKPITRRQDPNSAHLQINLRQLKRLYPDLDIADQAIMKTIGEQLVQGIRLSNGQVLVDERKIKQNVITVESLTISQQDKSLIAEPKPIPRTTNYRTKTQVPAQVKRSISIKRRAKETLLKTTRYFQKNKFLITVGYEEKPIQRIVSPSLDETFQQFEASYEIIAQNLGQLSEPQIIWSITPEEAKSLCISQDKLDVARYLMKRIQILGTKFVFLLDQKEDILKVQPNENVVFFYEGSIRPIQKIILQRKILLGRKEYQSEMNTWRDKQGKFTSGMYIYTVSLLKTKSTEFIIMGGEQRHRKFQYNAWKITNFKHFHGEIPKQAYLNFVQDRNKKRILAGLIVLFYLTYSEADDKMILQLPSSQELMNEIEDQEYQQKESSPRKVFEQQTKQETMSQSLSQSMQSLQFD